MFFLKGLPLYSGFIILATFVYLTAPANATTIVRVGDGTGASGSTQNIIPIYLENDTPIAGLQLDLGDSLNALEIDTVLATERSRDFTIMHHENRIIVFSMRGASISEGGEELLQVSVSVKAPAPAAEDIIFASKFILADSAGERVADVEVENGRFTIGEVTLVEDTGSDMPQAYALEQNYPNPFNPSTTLRFVLKESGFVRLDVYNALGKKVRTLVSGSLDAGQHNVIFNGQDMPSGLYFAHLAVNNFTIVRKMLLIK